MNEEVSELEAKTEKEKIKELRLLIGSEVMKEFIKIQEWYRSPSYTHTFKLMVEDMGKMIENGSLGKGIKGE